MSINEAPEGFDISAGRVMADGWAKKEDGAVIQGRLLGRFLKQSDDAYYQVKLSKDCKATSGRGEDAKEVLLKPGQVVNVDESKALEDLKRYSDNGGVYDVWIKYGALQKKPDGGTFWPIQGPMLKQIKAPPKEDKVPF